MCTWKGKRIFILWKELSFEKNYKYSVFIFIVFLFSFVLTSQFYHQLENTFQSIIYNETDGMPFNGNCKKGRFAESFYLYGIFVISYSCWQC